MINASESHDFEEEFPARNYTALNKSKRLLIDPRKLKDHFENHFAPRPTDIQPEIEIQSFSLTLSLHVTSEQTKISLMKRKLEMS